MATQREMMDAQMQNMLRQQMQNMLNIGSRTAPSPEEEARENERRGRDRWRPRHLSATLRAFQPKVKRR